MKWKSFTDVYGFNLSKILRSHLSINSHFEFGIYIKCNILPM